MYIIQFYQSYTSKDLCHKVIMIIYIDHAVRKRSILYSYNNHIYFLQGEEGNLLSSSASSRHSTASLAQDSSASRVSTAANRSIFKHVCYLILGLLYPRFSIITRHNIDQHLKIIQAQNSNL